MLRQMIRLTLQAGNYTTQLAGWYGYSVVSGRKQQTNYEAVAWCYGLFSYTSGDDRMLNKDHYKQALDIQNACNLSGVVFTFAKVMQAICDEAHEQGQGTDWKNSHSICVLFADKITSLTQCNQEWAYTNAYRDAMQKSE